MNHPSKHDARREELLLEIQVEEKALRARIAGNNEAIVAHKHKATEHSLFQRYNEAWQETNAAGRRKEDSEAAEKRLRALDLERHRIYSSNHPELAGLLQVETMAASEKRHAELRDAQAKFFAMITPELRSAAQRFVTAFKEANPLLPEPSLVTLLMEGV